MQKPTIGRMVYYKNLNDEICPAVISKVINDEKVNLFVMDDEKGFYFEKGVVEGDDLGRWKWPVMV